MTLLQKNKSIKRKRLSFPEELRNRNRRSSSSSSSKIKCHSHAHGKSSSNSMSYIERGDFNTTTNGRNGTTLKELFPLGKSISMLQKSVGDVASGSKKKPIGTMLNNSTSVSVAKTSGPMPSARRPKQTTKTKTTTETETETTASTTLQPLSTSVSSFPPFAFDHGDTDANNSEVGDDSNNKKRAKLAEQ
eukprot:m.5727 g.5727  ORF g.5727 m.5727 type:complete len:190 (-) comp4574_c0_seq1:63-632(-)